MELYHVTPLVNLSSISDEGVSPEKSKGKLKVSWWVDKKALAWAVAHVSAKYATPVNELVVLCAILPDMEVKKSGREGVYYTYSAIDDWSGGTCEHFLELAELSARADHDEILNSIPF